MRRPSSFRWVVLGAVFALLAAGCGDRDPAGGPERSPSESLGPPAPPGEGVTLRVTQPPPGWSGGGNTVSVQLAVFGLTVVKADGDRSGASGHFHVFVDRDPVEPGRMIPREPGIIHSAENPVRVTGLSPGSHRLTVVMGDGAHVRIGEASARVDVTVTGPSVRATAPAEIKSGEPVVIDLVAEGITIAAPPARPSKVAKPGFAHYEIFVDKEPPPPGTVITAEMKAIHALGPQLRLGGLGPGDHVVWVTLGDNNHTVLGPLALDRFSVAVRE